jgi:beta-lactamase superfamily II metal-dependent hydrolase
MSAPITIRMYNVGFGDCFLIRFPTSKGQRTMLVDCGEHSASRGPFELDEVIGSLLADITDEQGVMHIDVVAVSHRHQDHVKGFEDPRWADVNVDEVWLPWTENPDDTEARSLLERQSGGSKKLAALAGGDSEAYKVAINSLTNENAMATLHTGFAGSPLRRFLPEPPTTPDESDRSLFSVLQTPVLPGVTVRVLGPSRDEDVMRQMDPPELERYINQPRDRVGVGGEPLPFARWRSDQASFQAVADFHHFDLRGLGDVVIVGRDNPYVLAVAIDQAVNNTSLMLLIQLGAAWLLFPGDSQWGTWDRVLRSDEGRVLLGRTTFYKVGHHGSHNATPRRFVEELLHDADAMVSVAPTGIPSWRDIPKAELLTELVQPGRCEALAISQDLTSPPAKVTVEKDGLITEINVAT